MTLSFALYPFHEVQDSIKILSSSSNGEIYFLGKNFSGCEKYQMQYGLIQQQYVSADNFAHPVTGSF